MFSTSRLFFPVTLALLAAAGGSVAQGAPPSARQACRPSAEALCRPEVSARNMAGVRACLVRNFDKVSPDCQAAMMAIRDKETSAKAEPATDPAPPASPRR